MSRTTRCDKCGAHTVCTSHAGGWACPECSPPITARERYAAAAGVLVFAGWACWSVLGGPLGMAAGASAVVLFMALEHETTLEDRRFERTTVDPPVFVGSFAPRPAPTTNPGTK